MTETRAQYLVRNNQHHREHRCPGCKTVFGTEVLCGSMLCVGPLLLRTFNGECGICGKEIWWSSATRHLERAIKRV